MSGSPPYDPAKFAVGTVVRIVDTARLRNFRQRWEWHHKLLPEQIQYGGRVTQVAKSFVYHGGDVTYALRELPGVWHESCLEEV